MRRERLLALMRKEFSQFFRDIALVVLVLYLFVEIAVCAWALSLDVRSVPMGVYDLDRSPASRSLVERLGSSESFRLVRTLSSERDVADALGRGLVKTVLTIPPEFAHHLAQGRTATVQLVADGSDSYTATLATGYAVQIIQDYGGELLARRWGITASRVHLLPQIRSEPRVWYDPALSFSHYNVLIMVALAVPIVGVVLMAAAIVREKEAGTLEQLLVTPIRPWELILAKLLPMLVIYTGGLGVGVAIATWGFGAPMRGNLGFFYAASLLAFLASAGIGAAIATASRNLQQALLLSLFVLYPLLFLSGTLTPISNMPAALQYLSLVSPLRYFITATLGIFMKGAGTGALWRELGALAILGVGIFTFSLVRLRGGLA